MVDVSLFEKFEWVGFKLFFTCKTFFPLIVWHLNSNLVDGSVAPHLVTILPWSPLLYSDIVRFGISSTPVPFFNVIS